MPCNNKCIAIKNISACCILFCLILSSCAQKPWDELLTEEETKSVESILRTMQQQEQNCFQSFETDMKMFWKTPAGDSAVEGYLALHSPSSIKFIVTNPLGQPLFAFAGNGKSFQILKTAEKKHIRGNVRSLAIRNNVPLLLAQGDWFAYLSGRVPLRKLTVEESAKGIDDSIWLKIVTAKGPYTTGSIHLQIDPLKKELLSYLFLDDNGDVLAEITYGEGKAGKAPCAIHTEIRVAGLPWGAAVRIKLENISAYNQFNKTDFSLPVPKSFNTQLWP